MFLLLFDYNSVQSLPSSRLLSRNLKIRIYKTIILPVVLYGCETWFLTLREEHRLRMIFGPKRDEVTGEWRKLHNEELHDLYSSPSTGCGKLTSFFIWHFIFKKGS
jgi:hypothetical protein